MSKGKIDWDALRAEYLAGGISQRKLAEKYGISTGWLMQKANAENWTQAREEAHSKAIEMTVQRTAEQASRQAVIAARIREKLLLKLEKEIDSLPESNGSLSRQSESRKENTGKGGSKIKEATKEYRLRELTAAWKDLNDGLMESEKRDGEVKVIIDV